MGKSTGDEQIIEFVAANIREARLAQGMTQKELAERASVDERYLRRVEAGEMNITILQLARFARSLGVEPARLLAEAQHAERRPGRPTKK